LIQDFIFAKEVRLGTYSDKGAPPPGAMVAARRRATDPNDESQYGDRVPYLITISGPSTRLADRAVPPEDMFERFVESPSSKRIVTDHRPVEDKLMVYTISHVY
jgi:DNA polymerase elongation subunit (family B)